MEAEEGWEADGWMRMTVTGWMTAVWVYGWPEEVQGGVWCCRRMDGWMWNGWMAGCG